VARPFKSKRRWYVCGFDRDGEIAVLTPRRGCTLVTTTVTDERIDDEVIKDPNGSLRANFGDELLVCGPAWTETQFAKVAHVALDGYRETLRVRLTTGGPIEESTKVVQVMRTRRAA
jgi:hypothetical protein